MEESNVQMAMTILAFQIFFFFFFSLVDYVVPFWWSYRLAIASMTGMGTDDFGQMELAFILFVTCVCISSYQPNWAVMAEFVFPCVILSVIKITNFLF